MLKEDLYPLTLFREFDQFVESQGDMFCMRESCDDCRFKDSCENEESEVFKDSVIPVRDIIRVDNTVMNYVNEISEGCENFSYKNGRFCGDVIPNSDIRIFKVINSLGVEYKNRELDFIVFQKGKYYCLKQRCSKCDLRSQCNNTIEVVRDKDRIVVFDAKAQEPRSFLLTTKITNNIEKVWLETFQNDSIREQPEYNSWELLFKHNGIDTTSEVYKLFTDKVLFYDKTTMYILQEKIYCYFNSKSDRDRQDLEKYSNKIISEFREYESEMTK